MSEPDYLTVYLYAHEMARKDIVKLKKENARLQAEVADLKSTADRFKAELDRVTSQNGYAYTGLAVSMLREELAHRMKDHFEIRKGHEATVQMVHKLQAEVERLRKAGDAMADCLDLCDLTEDWNAAKEGKQS